MHGSMSIRLFNHPDTGTKYVQVFNDKPVPICKSCVRILKEGRHVPPNFCHDCLQLTIEEAAKLRATKKRKR